MPRQFSRSDRVSGQLRRELAQLIQLEVKDPAVGFVSVSDVEVSRDLAHAKVFVTVFEKERSAATIKALQKAAGFLRSRLGQRLRMRNVPELHFHHDDSVEVGQRMDQLISSAVAKDNEAAEASRRNAKDGHDDAEESSGPDQSS